jgi:hypothetical protein
VTTMNEFMNAELRRVARGGATAADFAGDVGDRGNPGAPITEAQLGYLHHLGKLLGLSEDERRQRAGESLTSISRARASELIDAWKAEVPPTRGSGDGGVRPVVETAPTMNEFIRAAAGAELPRP